MTDFLSNPIVFALCFLTLGMFIGAFGSAFYYKRYPEKRIPFWKLIITVVVFFLWSWSVYTDIQSGTNNTSWFLHVFSGTVIAAANHELGEKMMKIIELVLDKLGK